MLCGFFPSDSSVPSTMRSVRVVDKYGTVMMLKKRRPSVEMTEFLANSAAYVHFQWEGSLLARADLLQFSEL